MILPLFLAFVLFAISLLLLAIAWVLGSIAIGVLHDAHRVSRAPHHDDGEDWPTGMDTWQ